MPRNSSTKYLFLNKTIWIIVTLALINVCLAIIFGLRQSIDIPTFHLDGAYQTASGLYRLADGQWPGKDFFPYLGIGLTFFLYPVFMLAGNDIAASVFASHCIVAFGFSIVICTITSLLADTNRLLIGLIFSTFALAFALWLYPNLPPFLFDRLTPGNSLRPLRSLIPYIVVIPTYLILKSKLPPFATYGLLGILAGMSFLWTNDFGLPTSSLLLAFALFWARKQKILTPSLATLIVGLALFSAIIGFWFSTRGHGLDLLRYNFVDVRFDQYWYFGPWTDDSRILSIADILNKLLPDFGWWSLAIFAFGAAIYLQPTLEIFLLLLIGLMLAGGGVLAILGGHRDSGYLSHFIFWCKLTLIIEVILFVQKILFEKYKSKKNFYKIATLGICLLIFSEFLITINIFYAYRNEKQSAQSDVSRFYVSELGGYLPSGYEKHIAMARESKDSRVVEEYWGLWSAVTRTQNRLPVDSVIHALGVTRDLFAATTKNNPPDLVVTSPRSMSIDWQPWSLSFNYWFYKPLLQFYTPVKTSPTTIVWKKNNSVTSWESVKCEVKNGKSPYFNLPESSSGFYEIDLNLKERSHSNRTLLLVKNNLSNVAARDGYISLNPQKLHFQFPVAIVDSRPKVFDFKIIQSQRELVQLESCQARRIVFDDIEIASMKNFGPEHSTYNHTDLDYLNGVGRNLPVFFVSNTSENEVAFKVGSKVRFSNGEVRLIVNRSLEHRLFLLLDGAPLDGKKVGFPNKIEIIK